MSSVALLDKAIQNKRLLVVAGAGISVLAPSNVPSWWGFNEALLAAIKGLARGFVPGVADAIDRLSLESLPVQAFSDLVVRSFAGDSYFPLLQALESRKTNANHRALAELSHRGLVRGVVTPNFDTLIERAFREAAVPLDLYVTRQHFLRAPRTGAGRLYKIHGSVTNASTLVDTVSQKSRGLPVYFRERIEREFARHHVVVIGFSGADLQFDDAYLPFEIAADTGLGVTWLTRPGSLDRMPDRAKAVIDRMGKHCAVIEGDLPGFFAKLGWESDVPQDSASTSAGDTVREQFDRWVHEPHIGPPSCAAFCARLFEIIGDESAAGQVIAAMRSADGVAGSKISLQAGLCLQIIALDCMNRGRHDEAITWIERLFLFFDAMRQRMTEEGHEEPALAKTERLQNLSGVWNNLGVCFRLSGKLEEASRALQEAMKLSQEIGYTRHMGTIVFNQALIADAKNRPDPDVLDMLALARSWASLSGDVTTNIEASLEFASKLAESGEYDAAIACLDATEPLLGILGVPKYALQLAVQRADLRVRRGDETGALRMMMTAADAQPEGSPLHRAANWQLVQMLMHSASHRAEMVARLDALLEYNDETICGVPETETLAKLRNGLRDDATNIPPLFLPELTPDSEVGGKLSDDELRRRLIYVEYTGDVDRIPAYLNELAFRQYNRPRHLKRLANATIQASRRAENSEFLANGLNLLGVACDLLGELDESVTAYQAALEIEPPERQANAMANLALVRSRTVNLDSARELFDDCITELDRRGQIDQATRSRMCLAERLADEGELDEAIRIGEKSLGDARKMANEAATRTLSGLVAKWTAARTAVSKAAGPDSTTTAPAAVTINGRQLTREELETWRATASEAPDLANLAIAEIDLGDEKEALEHLIEARRLYEKAGDTQGLSRCCNNMASLFVAREQWNQAIDWSQRALRLRQECMAWPGVVLTLANLTSYCSAAMRWREAIDFAEQCTAHEGTVTAPRQFATAWTNRARAHGALGEIPEARRALKHAEGYLATVDDEVLQGLWQTTANVIPPATEAIDRQGTDFIKSPLLATIQEAERLKALGEFEQALAALDSAERELGLRPGPDLARLIGTRGNVLQRAGKHKEAVAVFLRSAELFRLHKHDNGAFSAELNASSSLRELGRVKEAIQLLEQLAERVTTKGPDRASVLVQLAKAYWQPIENEGQLNRESREFNEALRLYAEARSYPRLSSMLQGIIALDTGLLHVNHGDHDLGIERLREAKAHFIDANAQEAEAVDEIFKQLDVDKV